MSVARISIVEYQSVDDAKVGIEIVITPTLLVQWNIFAEAQYLDVRMIAGLIDTAHLPWQDIQIIVPVISR